MYSSFTDQEKLATLTTCVFIAGADGVIQRSENSFFSTLISLMDAQMLVKQVSQFPQQEAYRIIRNMSAEKKELVKRAWLKMYSYRSGGQDSGYFTLGNSEEDKVIRNMSFECGIDISGRIYIDDFPF